MIKKSETPLASAAHTLEDDLARLESLAGELERTRINSEKSLQRARQSLEACSEHEAKLAESLQSFAEAMQGVQERQQRCMQHAAEATARIQARNEARAR